ncbi:MAG: type II toxin-antitoxin system prevent-host-death family antitoxin, partial [Geodermatophilaceae bacterium]|nr:type II toxin-antitoxin system prevent-host-death family antitoxin [Geodermatophilaceae bacterium]
MREDRLCDLGFQVVRVTWAEYEAKTQPSRLIDRALAGEDVVIARSGKPLVRLVPVERDEPRGGRGAWRG